MYCLLGIDGRGATATITRTKHNKNETSSTNNKNYDYEEEEIHKKWLENTRNFLLENPFSLEGFEMDPPRSHMQCCCSCKVYCTYVLARTCEENLMPFIVSIQVKPKT